MPIPVQVFSDYTCPYSYIATGVIDKLKGEFQLEDTWLSCEIHPEIPPEGVPLERVYGDALAERQETQRQRCVEVGLPFTSPRRLLNSRFAIEAAEFAREAGRHPEFLRAVYAAYFARSEDISDMYVLSSLATDLGMKTKYLPDQLAMGYYTRRREAIREEAVRAGVTGFPYFIFEGYGRVVGAQSLDHFRELLLGRV